MRGVSTFRVHRHFVDRRHFSKCENGFSLHHSDERLQRPFQCYSLLVDSIRIRFNLIFLSVLYALRT